MMIDDDDVDFAILAFNPITGIGTVIAIVLIVALAVVASRNKDECAARHCNAGHPALIKGQCLCVEAAQ